VSDGTRSQPLPTVVLMDKPVGDQVSDKRRNQAICTAAPESQQWTIPLHQIEMTFRHDIVVALPRTSSRKLS